MDRRAASDGTTRGSGLRWADFLRRGSALLALFLVLTTVGLVILVADDFNTAKREFQRQSHAYYVFVSQKTAENATVLRGFAALINLAESASDEQVTAYLEDLLQRYPDIISAQRHTLIDSAALPAYLEHMREAYGYQFGLSSLDAKASSPRELSFPTTFAYPINRDSAWLLGKDLASRADSRYAVETAIRTGRSIATGLIRLPSGRVGYLLVRALPPMRAGPGELQAPVRRELVSLLLDPGVFAGFAPIQSAVGFTVSLPGGSGADTVLYRSPRRGGAGGWLPAFRSVQKLEHFGQPFVIAMEKPVGWDIVRPTRIAFAAFFALIATALLGIVRHLYHQRDEERTKWSAAILTEKERYRSVLQSVDEGVIAVDAEGRIEFINPAAEHLTAWPSGEAIGKNLLEVLKLVGPMGRFGLGDQLADCIRRDETAEFPEGAVLLDRDRRPHFVEGAMSPLRGHGERRAGAVIVFRDLAPMRRRAVEAIRMMESRLRAVMDNAQAVIYIKDLDGKHLMVNAMAARNLNRSVQDIEGLTDADLYPPEVAERLRENDLTVARRAQAEIFEEELKAGGERRTFLSAKFPLFDVEGKVTAVGGISTDITDRIAMERALRESESKLAKAQRIARLGYWEWEAATGLISWSDQAAEIFCLPPGETMGYDQFMKLVHPGDEKRVKDTMRAALSGAAAYRLDHRIVDAQGTVRVVHSQGDVEFGADGRPARMVGVVQDVTERVRLEEAVSQHRNELAHVGRFNMMGEMAAGIAHEINQPLSAIVSYSSAAIRLLRGDTADLSKAIQSMEAAARQAERIGEIIRRLRAFMAKRPIQTEIIPVETLVGEIVALTHHEVAAHQVSLAIQVEKPLPALYIDLIQIEQVALNLIRNALEAMEPLPPDERCLTIRGGAIDGGKRVRLTFADTGPGLSAEAIEKLFHPFYTTKESGMGMGLAISQSIVEFHGGKLWATQEGHGALFHVELPAASVSKGAMEQGEDKHYA